MHQFSDANDAEGKRNRLVTVANSLVHRVVAALVGVREWRCWVPVEGHVLQSRVALVDARTVDEAGDWRGL